MDSDADPSRSEPAPSVDGSEVVAGERRAGASASEEPAHPERMGRADKVPVRMLSDRILVQIEPGEGERLSSGGILIPATAQLGKRLSWAEVRAVGPNVRSVQDGDQVLFNPEDVYEVEVRGESFIILRERDLHAVAAERLEEGHTGLYL
jgi:chaperonin GroES